MHSVESDIFKMLERKANVLDVQEALNQKADHSLVTNMPQKSEFAELVYKVDRINEEINNKLDSRGKQQKQLNGLDFDEFDEILRKKIEELQNHLLQKSNIKDVCALLDLKSSIFFSLTLHRY